jgi:hypothetical protein
MPVCVTTPLTRSPSRIRSSTACWKICRFSWFLDAADGGAVQHPVGLGPGSPHRRSLAPVEHAELDSGLSVASAMAPPRASTSRTRWLLPIPPIAGLQDICPSVSMLWVRSSVRQPIRAAARQASVPA